MQKSGDHGPEKACGHGKVEEGMEQKHPDMEAAHP